MTKKTLLPTNDLYLQFTDEEIQELGWEAGQKLEVKQHDDGSIELRPYVKLELDMEEWPREILELIVKESVEQDISANDVITNMIKEGLKLVGQKTDENCLANNIEYPYDDDTLKSVCGCSNNNAVLATAYNSEYTTSSSDMLPTTSNIKEHNISNEIEYVDPNFTNNDISIAKDLN